MPLHLLFADNPVTAPLKKAARRDRRMGHNSPCRSRFERITERGGNSLVLMIPMDI